MHMVQPYLFKLRDEELDYLHVLKEGFALISDKISQREAIKTLQFYYRGQYNDRYTYKIYHDIQNFFGSMVKVNKDYLRMQAHERLNKVIEMCEDVGEIKEMRLAVNDIARLHDLHTPDDSGLQPDDIKLPDLHITSDPSVLDAEDIDHEDVSDEEE